MATAAFIDPTPLALVAAMLAKPAKPRNACSMKTTIVALAVIGAGGLIVGLLGLFGNNAISQAFGRVGSITTAAAGCAALLSCVILSCQRSKAARLFPSIFKSSDSYMLIENADDLRHGRYCITTSTAEDPGAVVLAMVTADRYTALPIVAEPSGFGLRLVAAAGALTLPAGPYGPELSITVVDQGCLTIDGDAVKKLQRRLDAYEQFEQQYNMRRKDGSVILIFNGLEIPLVEDKNGFQYKGQYLFYHGEVDYILLHTIYFTMWPRIAIAAAPVTTLEEAIDVVEAAAKQAKYAYAFTKDAHGHFNYCVVLNDQELAVYELTFVTDGTYTFNDRPFPIEDGNVLLDLDYSSDSRLRTAR